MSATLQAIVREKLGTRAARKLRLRGRVPISLQSKLHEPLHLSIDEDQLLTARRAHEHLFDLEYDGKSEAALINELHWDTFSGQILHVEFRHVVRGEKTEAEVELTFTGMVRGGVLNHLVAHITIEAVPSEIPDGVEVSVDGMEVGSVLHAKDLVLPPGVELAMDPETTIAIVSTVREEATDDEDEDDDETEVVKPSPEA
ncbi:MAG: 50S ribosomal protein L25 [Planctomycetota bacterium]